MFELDIRTWGDSNTAPFSSPVAAAVLWVWARSAGLQRLFGFSCSKHTARDWVVSTGAWLCLHYVIQGQGPGCSLVTTLVPREQGRQQLARGALGAGPSHGSQSSFAVPNVLPGKLS